MLKKLLTLAGGFLIIATSGSTVLSCHKNGTNLENKIQNKQLGVLGAKDKGDYYIIQGIIETENPDLRNKIKVDSDLITATQAVIQPRDDNDEYTGQATVFFTLFPEEITMTQKEQNLECKTSVFASIFEFKLANYQDLGNVTVTSSDQEKLNAWYLGEGKVSFNGRTAGTETMTIKSDVEGYQPIIIHVTTYQNDWTI